jgi:hypothetical protein
LSYFGTEETEGLQKGKEETKVNINAGKEDKGGNMNG